MTDTSFVNIAQRLTGRDFPHYIWDNYPLKERKENTIYRYALFSIVQRHANTFFSNKNEFLNVVLLGADPERPKEYIWVAFNENFLLESGYPTISQMLKTETPNIQEVVKVLLLDGNLNYDEAVSIAHRLEK